MEQTLALIERSHKGDKDARNILAQQNMGLVYTVARRFNGRGCEMEDLIQIGSIGLLKAIDKFDLSYDVRFSTYAVPMILGECRRYLRDNNSIRVSRSLRDIAYKAIYTKDALLKKLDREPTVDEIAKEIDVAPEDITTALDAISTPVSLYEPVYQEGGDTLYIVDQLSDKKNKEENWVENISLKEAMKKLNEREYNILRLRFFEGKTQTEVASEIAISQAQVSRIEKSAIKSLKGYLR